MATSNPVTLTVTTPNVLTLSAAVATEPINGVFTLTLTVVDGVVGAPVANDAVSLALQGSTTVLATATTDATGTATFQTSFSTPGTDTVVAFDSS